MSRRYLIIASVAAHAAVGLGLFVSGVWKIEKLDYRHRVSLTLGAMIPGDSGGGEGEQKQEAKKQEKKKEKQKTKVKEPRQIDKLPTEAPAEVALADTGGGGGEGEGEGPGVGPATGGGGGGGTCDPLLDPNQCQPVQHKQTCGDGILEGTEQCDDGNVIGGDKCSASCKIEQIIIPPGIFQGMRISGDTQIVPPDPVKTQMLREGNERTQGSFKLCIDTSGRMSSITPIGNGTKYPAYDAKITSTMRGWLYHPYTVKNQGVITPVPACSVVTFVYTIK